MVYAMCSIGILGFVVWSQWLAFPSREEWVINSTVGWNGLLFLFLFLCFIINSAKLGNLLDTFYSLNANKNARSAGNLTPALYGKEGSSETIRGNTYGLFKNNFAYFFKQEFFQNDAWLSWFVGFLEGDGAILEHKGRCFFVLTQKDDTTLDEICETLKIGKVKHFYDKDGNRKYSRFIVSENKGIFLLYLLLNGNLVLEARVNQLRKWGIALKNASRFNYSLFSIQKLPCLIDKTKDPTLNDAWLSGFTDAKGCFSVKIANAKGLHYVSLWFVLDQKNEPKVLNKIGSLFSENKKAILRTPNPSPRCQAGRLTTQGLHRQVRPEEETLSLDKKINNMFRLSLYCNDKKRITSNKLINYFNTYKLKTTKYKSFYIWIQILDIVIGNQPLSLENLSKVRKLRHNMNYYIISNNSIGYANKS